jgi:hypothetical protein
MSPDAAVFPPVRVGAPDDSLIRALAEHRPARRGWNVRPLDGPPEAGALVILDFDDGQTRSALRDTLRAQGFAGPIVILGGCDAATSGPATSGPAASGPAASGAPDEPVPRPVRLGLLLARLDAHAEASADPDAITLGPYRFEADARLLRGGSTGRVIRLTELEQDLLVYLSAAEGALVGREQLLADVWGYSEGVDTHTVETHVWRLRQKIETDDPATRFLVTEIGGYRLLVGGGQDV